MVIHSTRIILSDSISSEFVTSRSSGLFTNQSFVEKDSYSLMYRMHKLINRLIACCVYSIVPSQPLPVYASLYLPGTCQASIPSCMGDIDCSQSQRTSWVAKLSLKPLCVILVCILASLKYEVQSFKLKVSCNNFKLSFSKDTKLINNCDCCC